MKTQALTLIIHISSTIPTSPYRTHRIFLVTVTTQLNHLDLCPPLEQIHMITEAPRLIFFHMK